MGWIALIAFFAIALATLWRFGEMPAAGLQTCAAALLMGCVGYAWQGSPDLPSQPAVALVQSHTQHPEQIMRRAMMGAFGGSAQILDVADVLIRDHATADAVGLLQNTVKQYPQNADLWVGFGNALVAHNGGIISPAARFAFDRH